MPHILVSRLVAIKDHRMCKWRKEHMVFRTGEGTFCGVGSTYPWGPMAYTLHVLLRSSVCLKMDYIYICEKKAGPGRSGIVCAKEVV